jgi:cell wall-associated NlpC family hydrolase
MSDVVSAIARVSQIIQGLQTVEAVASGSSFATAFGDAAVDLGSVGLGSDGTPVSVSAPASTDARRDGAAPSPAAPEASGLGERAIEQAETVLGRPYVWGAEGPSGFDCSGLVYWAFHGAGADVPRLSADGFMSSATPVLRDDLRPGDLVFYNYGRLAPGVADHIGIYVDDDRVIEASSSAGAVVVRPVDWDNVIGTGRLD